MRSFARYAREGKTLKELAEQVWAFPSSVSIKSSNIRINSRPKQCTRKRSCRKLWCAAWAFPRPRGKPMNNAKLMWKTIYRQERQRWIREEAPRKVGS